MKKYITFALVCGIVLSLSCSADSLKSSSGQEAIKNSQKLKTKKAMEKYLLGQANAFYKAQKCAYASEVSRHILTFLNKDCLKARELLSKSDACSESAVKKTAEDTRKKLEELKGIIKK